MILLVNFGGPRDLDEIPAFLTELLTDRDVIRTRLPAFIQNWIFRRVARKRALKIRHDYELIGGRSPIYFDTEEIAKKISAMTFHRYLPKTHEESLRKIEECEAEEIRVIPLFPQFSFATTGSIARFLAKHLSPRVLRKLRWVQSYAAHPAFIASMQRRIREYIRGQKLEEETIAFLYSAHGVPRSFIADGDVYEAECKKSFEEVKKGFPKAFHRLSFQSKFGPGEWLRPYTDETCREAASWGRQNVVIVPISFTSDHIETLFEIEELYLPILRNAGVEPFRCPALNLEDYWVEGLGEIIKSSPLKPTKMLVRS